MSGWTPESWRQRSASQQVDYPDQGALERVLAEMARRPPLVEPREVETLKTRLAEAAKGRAFLLQGGDCAESFEDPTANGVAETLETLLGMSVALVKATARPVVRVGRIAGQYAKPRSSDYEHRGDLTLPSYRGDLVNRRGFTLEERRPDPELMLHGYEHAARTLERIRLLTKGRDPAAHNPAETLAGGDLFTSHEALVLGWETAHTRWVAELGGWYNLSTHFPWIGMRTTQVDGAHVEYCRGIQNPIGVKIGPDMTADQLGSLLDRLHPQDEPGRLTLIHRMGHARIARRLPALIDAVRRSGKTVLFCADPMHGNTERAAGGIKTRRFDNILSELRQAFDIHRAMGSTLGGVHFELTGGDVTECIGGPSGPGEADLRRAYRSPVDPRLNRAQSLEMARRIAARVAGG